MPAGRPPLRRGGHISQSAGRESAGRCCSVGSSATARRRSSIDSSARPSMPARLATPRSTSALPGARANARCKWRSATFQSWLSQPPGRARRAPKARSGASTRLPDLRTLPSSTVATLSFYATVGMSRSLPLKENADVRAVAGGDKTCDAIERRAEVVAVARFERCAKRGGRRVEGRAKRVAYRLEHVAAVRANRARQEGVVPRERGAHRGLLRFPQPRAALDVGEQQRHTVPVGSGVSCSAGGSAVIGLGPVNAMDANANGWHGAPIKAADEATTERLCEENNAEWRPMPPVPFGLLPKNAHRFVAKSRRVRYPSSPSRLALGVFGRATRSCP